MSPTIFTGAANSNNIGWDMKILRDLAQMNLISSLVKLKVFGFCFERPAATKRSIIESKSMLVVDDLDDLDDLEVVVVVAADEFDGGGCLIFGSRDAFGGVEDNEALISGDLLSSIWNGRSFEFVEEGEVEGVGEADEDEKEDEFVISLMEYKFLGTFLRVLLAMWLFDAEEMEESETGVKQELPEVASPLSSSEELTRPNRACEEAGVEERVLFFNGMFEMLLLMLG